VFSIIGRGEKQNMSNLSVNFHDGNHQNTILSSDNNRKYPVHPGQSFVLEHRNAEVQCNEGFDLLLSHFEPPIWPRRISTKTTQGKQILVHNKQEALARFKQANFIDCRINAYNPFYVEYSGTNRQAPDFIFVDIDKSSFNTQKTYNLALAKTLKNFKDKLPGSCPTVLDTGNGCHFYQPIFAPFVLETGGGNVFTKLNSEPSKAFLKFAEHFLSNGKADHSHNPTFRSCMIRMPGSINPPLDEQIDFKIRYKVVPRSSERQFFQTVVFLLIGASLFFSLISTGLVDSRWSFIFKRIEQHLNAFFGGIVTISVAAIGFSNKPMLNKTRFWFIVPIIISGFLLEK
jgi:hypothetical protein